MTDCRQNEMTRKIIVKRMTRQNDQFKMTVDKIHIYTLKMTVDNKYIQNVHTYNPCRQND